MSVTLRFQSAPEFITPGNVPGHARPAEQLEFQSAPEFITPGNNHEL